eukprot:1543985-Rhodomonas_salina.1
MLRKGVERWWRSAPRRPGTEPGESSLRVTPSKVDMDSKVKGVSRMGWSCKMCFSDGECER